MQKRNYTSARTFATFVAFWCETPFFIPQSPLFAQYIPALRGPLKRGKTRVAQLLARFLHITGHLVFPSPQNCFYTHWQICFCAGHRATLLRVTSLGLLGGTQASVPEPNVSRTVLSDVSWHDPSFVPLAFCPNWTHNHLSRSGSVLGDFRSVFTPVEARPGGPSITNEYFVR